MSDLLEALRAAVGAAQVMTEGDLSAYELDWRKRWRGKALAVVRPGRTTATGGTAAAQARISAATSSVQPGRATARQRPR